MIEIFVNVFEFSILIESSVRLVLSEVFYRVVFTAIRDNLYIAVNSIIRARIIPFTASEQEAVKALKKRDCNWVWVLNIIV